MTFCLFFIFGYWVFQKKNFFGLLSKQRLKVSYEVAFFSALWMVSSES
jgi:hypothetical protein